MPYLFLQVKHQLIKLMDENIKFCSVTTDLWSSAAMDAYMAVTVHFIS